MNSMHGELPIGFAMSLSMSPEAMKYYSTLSLEQQTDIVKYVQNNKTGIEAKQKVYNAIQGLENNNLDFL